MGRLAGSVCALVLALGSPRGASAAPEIRAEGATMGTTYAVRVALPPPALSQAGLEAAVARVLARVDGRLSTYRDDSELEGFNRQRGTGWFAVSPETARVARAARDLARRSGGAFDPTVGPLVRLWGFGPGPPGPLPPAPERLAAVRRGIGFRHLHVRETPPALRKDRGEIELDLSGIGKGYAVDAIAEHLLAAGARHFLVEVGGEIRARGRSARREPWVVGIEPPLPGSAELPARVALEDASIATSGPYRQFRVREGVRLSHLLDPRTGAPVESDLISVSVIAASAMLADGWATALFVAGPEAGFALAEREQLAASFLSAADGATRRRATSGFESHRREREDRGPREDPRP